MYSEHLLNRPVHWKGEIHCHPNCVACRVERSQPVSPPCKLQLEECLSAEQVPTPELIQGYVKKVGLFYKCQAECLVRLCPAGKRIARDREGWLQGNCGGFYSKQMNVVGGFSRRHYFCYRTLNCFIQHVTLSEEPENTTLKCLQLCQQAIML